MLRVTLAATLAALLAACGSSSRSSAPAVALVDSLPALEEEDVIMLYRVEVRSGRSVDTIAGVRVTRAPLSVENEVVGLAVDSIQGVPRAAFRYDPATKSLQFTPLMGVAKGIGTPVLSPDGRHVAYVATTEMGTAHVEVRSLADGRLVGRGPMAELPNAEYLEMPARWTAPDAFEVHVALSDDAEGGPWQRVRGSVGGSVAVDTVTSLPAGS